jgi:AAA domain
MNARLDPQTIARALGGEAHGNIVRAPSPGQKPTDRSLKVKVSDDLSGGFTVTDYYGGSYSWEDLKDYVREQVGEPTWDERNPKVDYVARMNARAMGATGPLDFDTAGPRREKKKPYAGSAKAADEPQLGPIVATYDYTDLDGTLLYQVTRHDPKAFRQRRPDGNGGWIDNLYGVKRVLYRWPDLARFPDVPVFVCEGEKDADRLASLGYCATTVAAGDCESIEWNETCEFTSREVFILADNDFPGRKRAYATQLWFDIGTAASIKIVALPGLPPDGDVSDWLDTDPTRADTLLEVCRAVPEPHRPPLPSRTPPNEKGKPGFVVAGDEGPPVSSSEKRRHFYRQYNPDFQDHCCISPPVAIKVLKKDKEANPYSTYRVYDEAAGVTGWQFKMPDGFERVPYFVPGKNPFAKDALQLPLYWPEGEKDADTLAALGLAAFTFGGGDGLPSNCEKYIAGRDIIITADNDDGGRKQAEAKAARALGVAASVKVIHFPDTKEKGDVTDWLEAGHTLEEMKARVDGTPPPEPNSPPKGMPLTFFDDVENFAKKVWLLKEAIAKGETSEWIAAPGMLKSALLADISVCIASGTDWRGYRSKEICGVVYFALERADLVKRRLTAHRRRDELEGLPIAVAGGVIDLIHPANVTLMIDTIQAAEEKFGCNVGFVVIDTLAKGVAAGGGDENQAKDMGRALANLRAVQDQTGAHIAIVSHTGKDEKRGARGSNSQVGDVDLLVQISGDSVKVATVTKANDQKEGVLTQFKGELAVLGEDEDGDDISTMIISADDCGSAASSKSKEKTSLTPKQRRAMDLLIKAINDVGRAPPPNAPPGVVKVVTLDDWRKSCKEGALSDDDDANRMAFNRAKTDLANKGRIGIKNEWVWIAYD